MWIFEGFSVLWENCPGQATQKEEVEELALVHEIRE